MLRSNNLPSAFHMPHMSMKMENGQPQPMDDNKPNVFYQQQFNYLPPYNLDSSKQPALAAPYNHQYQMPSMDQQGAVGGYLLENVENLNPQWNISQQHNPSGANNFLSGAVVYQTTTQGSNGYVYPAPQHSLQRPQQQQQLSLSMGHLQVMDKDRNPQVEYQSGYKNTSELIDNIIDGLDQTPVMIARHPENPIDMTNGFNNL